MRRMATPVRPETSTAAGGRARYIMIGGFLGAGKTTAILKFAQHLQDQNKRVGLITNDQGHGLVDTHRALAGGFAVEEIPGGCFCCRFNSLIEASSRLAKQTAPDAFIAEPVGSCTDLVATVVFPLRRLYGNDYRIAPLSVLVDPIRALRILGIEQGRKFSDKVVYIYLKQLEEADIIVINKCDLLDSTRLANLRSALAERFPRAEIFECSARNGTGLDAWFERIQTTESSAARAMEIDYATYGEGESLLGWLNATIRVSAKTPFDGNALLLSLATRLHEHLKAENAEVAHLKMTLLPAEDDVDIGVVNLVRTDDAPVLSHELMETLSRGELIINMRAEVAPETLESLVRSAVPDPALAGGASSSGPIKFQLANLESFRPAPPKPVHREMVSI